MDWLNILEQYGIPIVVAIAFGVFIWKQNKFIQEELQKELRESFDRVEGIIIKLIDQQKKMQIEQKGLERSYKTLVEVISSLSGNGLKHRFLRMMDKDE
jgi:hypothetical protein